MKKDWRQYGEGGKNRWSKEKESDIYYKKKDPLSFSFIQSIHSKMP